MPSQILQLGQRHLTRVIHHIDHTAPRKFDDRGLGDDHGVSQGLDGHRTLTKATGHSRPSDLSKYALSLTVPEPASTELSTNSSRPIKGLVLSGRVISTRELLRCIDRSATRGDGCLLFFNLGLVGVQSTLRHKALGQPLLASCQLAQGVGQRGLVLGQLRNGLGDVRLVRSRIQGKSQLTFFDELTLLHVHLVDHAGDLGFDVNHRQRRHRACGFYP
jgi:hypothetical protein